MNDLTAILKDEKFLQNIREKYFTFIRDRIITGYNLQTLHEDEKIGLSFSYFHSDLKDTD